LTDSIGKLDAAAREIDGSPQRDPRLCTHGGSCKAYAVKDGSGICLGHQKRPGQLEKARERSAEVRRSVLEERPKSLKDAVAKRLEARANEIAALIDKDLAREDSTSVRAWMVQAYGQPAQTVVTNEGSKDAAGMTLQELEAARARLLEEGRPRLVKPLDIGMDTGIEGSKEG
jgi:hypothetical protein